jgi:hypothetical protein
LDRFSMTDAFLLINASQPGASSRKIATLSLST